jgi:site-specific recombinase XerD
MGLSIFPYRKPRFLDLIRLACRRRQISPHTEAAYVYWIRRYILFHGKRHPSELDKPHLEAFLNYLASGQRVSASTQSLALNALVFMYREVLDQEPGWLDQLRRVQRKTRLPVVLSQREVALVLENMAGVPRLIAQRLYGSGLRVSGCATLRVKDIDFDQGTLLVRSGKENKDRITVLPRDCRQTFTHHLLRIAE